MDLARTEKFFQLGGLLYYVNQLFLKTWQDLVFLQYFFRKVIKVIILVIFYPILEEF
jgi:hypothetical protein